MSYQSKTPINQFSPRRGTGAHSLAAGGAHITFVAVLALISLFHHTQAAESFIRLSSPSKFDGSDFRLEIASSLSKENEEFST